MAIETEKTLFGHCTFAFVISKDLPESQALEVRPLHDLPRFKILTCG